MVHERIYLSKLINNEDSSNIPKKLFKSIISRISKISYEDLVYDKERSDKQSGSNKNYSFQLPEDIHNDIIKYESMDYDGKKIYGYPYGVDCETRNFHRTHMDEISVHFKGLGFGYKLYKATAMHIGHLSSESDASSDAQHVWQYLAKDKDFYTILTTNSILIISKKLPKEEVEDLVFKFLKDRAKIKKQIFTKENYRKMKLDCVLFIGQELCDLLEEYKLSRLNINYVEKYVSIYTRTKYKKIDAEFPIPFLGQNVIDHKTKEEFKISSLERFENSVRYIVRNRHNVEYLNRDKFFVMDNKIPRKTKDINQDEFLKHKMYLDLSGLTSDDIGCYESPYFVINQINYDNNNVTYIDNNGYVRDINKFKLIKPINITYDNILPNRHYYVIYEDIPHIAKLVSKKSDNILQLSLNTFRGWRSEYHQDIDLEKESITFLDYSVEDQKTFLETNKSTIEDTKDEMLKLMKAQHRKEKREEKKEMLKHL